MAPNQRTSRWYVAPLAGAVITATACIPAPPRANFNDAIRKVIEADTLVDGRLSAEPTGWQVGLLPRHAGPGSGECPAPLGAWPLQHMYRNQPALGAEVYVLAIPWLSPADVDAVRAGAWRGHGVLAEAAGVQANQETPVGDTRYRRGAWQFAGPAAPMTVELLLRPWPGGSGTYIIGACAPSTQWDRIRPTLLQVAAALEPVVRSGLEVATERANALEDAARAWRFILPPEQVAPRVTAGRQEALAALRASGFETSASGLRAAADVEAMDTQGVEAGAGYDARAVAALLTRASELDPSHFHAGELFGRALLDSGDPARAIEVLERRAAGLPRPQASLLVTLGDARLATGNRSGAEEAWRRARSTLDQDRRFRFPSGPLAANLRRMQEDLAARLDARLGPAGTGATRSP